MEIERPLLDGKRDLMKNKKKIMKKKKSRRKRNHREISIVQKLFNACKEVFCGPESVPPPPQVQKMILILERMRLEHLGLSGDTLFYENIRDSDGTRRIVCSTIYMCGTFSICLFFLPQSSIIPLHNHPGMTVFSKLLIGSMHVKSYDWADPDKPDDPTSTSHLRLAKLKIDSDFTAPCKTNVLFPTTGGNIHMFTAITPCVILDVMGPPYIREERDCTYYRDFPLSHYHDGIDGGRECDENHGWLEEIKPPEDLMHTIEYRGPKVCDNSGSFPI